MNARGWADARLEDRPQRAADVEAAYDFCLRVVRNGGDDFRPASWFEARPLRRHAAALAAFRRVAEDFADGPEHEGLRAQRLEDWRRQLWAAGKEPARHPVFLALEKTLLDLDLPKEPFDDLIKARLQDCEKKRFETFDELLGHCRLRANPAGRLALMIHGYRGQELFELSDRICTALALVGFLKDLSTDIKRDRLYIPLQDFRECGYTEADMRMGVVNERFRNLARLQWKRARALFEEGRPLPGRLRWPLDWDVRLRWLGGMEVLRKIHKLDYDTTRRRPQITAWSWAGLILKALAKR